MIDSDQRLNSNRHSLTSLSQITVQFRGILISESFSNSQIYGQFIDKVLGCMSMTSIGESEKRS